MLKHCHFWQNTDFGILQQSQKNYNFQSFSQYYCYSIFSKFYKNWLSWWCMVIRSSLSCKWQNWVFCPCLKISLNWVTLKPKFLFKSHWMRMLLLLPFHEKKRRLGEGDKCKRERTWKSRTFGKKTCHELGWPLKWVVIVGIPSNKTENESIFL